MSMKVAIGIDLGGTNVKGILLQENGEILHTHNIATRDDADGKWKKNVLEMVQYLKTKYGGEISLVGMSAPGLANAENRAIAHLPNRLLGLENFIWADYFSTNTYVLNDAHAALMAEAKYGSLKSYKNGLLLTLGTGVGGGIMINGELYQGLSQMAGHFGHLSVNSNDDNLSILGTPGSLEYTIGNYSISQRTFGRYKSTHELVAAYEAGDSFATWVWLESIRKLAVALASLVNIFSPEAIVLSGGISLAGLSLYKPLRQFFDIFEFKPQGKTTEIIQAKFGDLSGAIGAAAFALTRNI
jgi:glucokinase